jgi:sodium transport system permease protein
MNWSNVKLIFAREVRDQLRDRRTLFMIAVLPMLLYPLLGTSFLQLAQFLQEKETSVLVVGAAELTELNDLPPLIENNQFAGDLFGDPDKARLLKLTFARDEPRVAQPGAAASPEEQLEQASELVSQGAYQLVVYIPPDFGEQLEAFRNGLLRAAQTGGESADNVNVPSPTIFYNTASEKSRIAFSRFARVMERWTVAIGQQNLRDSKVPVLAARPFEFSPSDVAAASGHRNAAIWSKLLPFVLLIWALTGAFYPAIDLCAGEKERGTLETLLSSPAERSEIVWGKLATVMLFSVATAVLNLASMGLTGAFVIRQLSHSAIVPSGLGMPPISSLAWLLLALLPVAALFSALCLALAAFARSTKEGQYYLMPLVLITMPLMILPMAPGVELTLGNSLIPVTGVVLLLRTVLEGNYFGALPFIAPVVAVTALCCLLAVRWAIDQFNKESVLFRESERLDLGLWVRHLVRDRGPTPTIGEAFSCFVLIMLVQFFINLAMRAPNDFRGVAQVIFISQVVVIAMPALLLTIMLTSSPARTLLIDRLPRLMPLVVAFLLALAINPVVHALSPIVQKLYPVNEQMIEASQALMQHLNAAPYAWLPFLLIAVLPAFCEELAFRGFLLSGLRHLGHKWWAIVLSAVFFGMVHTILQQSLMAAAVGVVLGFIAVQCGSLWPCIVFHVTHNSLGLLSSRISISPESYEKYPILGYLFERVQEGGQVMHTYGWPLVAAGGIAACYLLYWLHRLPYQKTSEEQLQEALDHQQSHSLAG